MANEISVTTNLTATKGNLSFARSVTTNATMNLARKGDFVQSIPTTAAGTALTIPAGVTTNGWTLFRNLDATNYVEIGSQTGGTTFLPVGRLNAGESALFRLAQGVSIYARANTGAVDLEANVLND